MSSNDPKKLKFSWCSLRTLFSAVFVAFSFVFLAMMFYRQVKQGPLSPSNVVGIFFYGNCAMISVFFFEFAMKFSLIMERWRQVERSLQFREAFLYSDGSLRRRVVVCATVALTAALIEHLLSLASRLQFNSYESKVCNLTNDNALEDFITKHLGFTFSIIKYNHFNGIFAEYLNISLTFCWSFIDIFVMIISIGLSFNYEEINNRIKFFKERVVQDEVWAEIRINYNKVSELLKFVDKQLAKMIILACFNDFYFISVQLLNLAT